MDVDAPMTVGVRSAYGEVVWSWRRDRGVYFAGGYPADNGDNQRRSPGRARISRKAIAWGKPGCLGCTCSPWPMCFSTWVARVLRRTGSTGAVSARLSLRPLSERGTTKLQNSGETMSRECASTLPRHCERCDPSPLAAQASLGRQSAKTLLRAGGSNPASFRKKAGLLH